MSRSGQGEECYPRSYKRRRWYDDYDDDEDEGNADTITEEEERTVNLKNIRDIDGDVLDLDFGDVDLNHAAPPWDCEDVEPDEKDGT